MSDKIHAIRAIGLFAASAILASVFAPLPMASPAHAAGNYHHCKTSSGPVGPNYLVPTGGTGGLYCFESFWTLQEAIGRACYFTSLRRGMIWPQMTDAVPDYGIRIKCH